MIRVEQIGLKCKRTGVNTAEAGVHADDQHSKLFFSPHVENTNLLNVTAPTPLFITELSLKQKTIHSTRFHICTTRISPTIPLFCL
ncbi:hypothetical protein AMELA_G00242950 [Ameiurus melas]|uniref:Uncharacterized protein n=1 Tax=Ameiurus melas TaxID=219545 RepID=A0A7J5ZXV9_AMEME|nr:hypothetical protein AMELA_G00242950 [Ameiurus melas]